MELQDRYDELDNIILGIDDIVENIKDKYYIDMLKDLKYEAQTEQEEIEERLQKEHQEEEYKMNYEFERSRL
nr:MAG TPA: hypothetical protein [Caudoviricetes sp.]